jgi:hypothetical protein
MKLTPKEEFRLAAKTIAEWHEANYPDAEMDAEVTETGYSDLPKEVREAGSWTEFHAMAKRQLADMRGE